MDGIPQAFVFFRFVDIIVITVHDRFWNVGQANCILKFFENMMIDHSDSTGSFLLAWNLFNSNFSVLISSCNFDLEKNSLCAYVRYEYTE
jgi:hypothetical protein